MKAIQSHHTSVRGDEPRQGRDPIANMSSLVITGSAIGGVLSIGLFVVVWGALPVARPFLIAALAAGGIFGFILWLRRR
ncbi:MAG TPA: hypothetical protein VN822_13475 [Candidatus Acidoferrales bacterium]|nr:hypothetical protein [Candidatus Acidoferrales bacterium]